MVEERSWTRSGSSGKIRAIENALARLAGEIRLEPVVARASITYCLMLQRPL